MHRPALFGLLSSALVLTGAGCGANLAERATESYVENAIERESGGKVDVDLGGNGVSYRDEEGNEYRYGEDVQIPANFPKEIPVYENAKVMAVATAEGQSTISFSTPATATEVTAWYEAKLKAEGWAQAETYNAQGMSYRRFTKDGKQMVLSIGAQEGAGTVVTISETNE